LADLKILCTADLHLGRSSTCIEAPAGVDTSAAGAWKRLVHRAKTGEASAVVIAGDIFDCQAGYYETYREFLSGLEDLDAAGIPVVAVAGNHDWEVLPRVVRQHRPANLHLLGLGGRWESIELQTAEGPVRFLGWSFPEERVMTNQFASLPSLTSGIPTVGIIHGDIVPRTPYHPVTARDFESGADAWVLGHVHGPQAVTPIAHYPGSPQAFDYGMGEQGPHGFKWLTFDPTPRFSDIQPISTIQFHDAELYVEPREGESHWDAAIRVGEEEAKLIRAEQPDLRSVQLRARAVFASTADRLRLPESHDMSQDGCDAIYYVDYRFRPSVDPWDLVETPKAKGAMARLLLGLRHMGETPDEPRWNPDWRVQAIDLVEGAVEDVRSQHRRTVEAVSDTGDNSRTPPGDEDARRIAREALIVELESMLQEPEAVS
jgi:exonuclease SbcD